jgi:hypothetical protein
MTLGEKREQEYNELQERREKEKGELQNELESSLNDELIEILSIKEIDDGYRVNLVFTLDGFSQKDDFYWNVNDSQEDFINNVKGKIEYIKELRGQYLDYCKKNDYIQTNSEFRKEIALTHMGYEKSFYIDIRLADYLKLPNTTSCSVGGGDYEIKRTPKRVSEYNNNIDITIDALLDCIAELKQKKYVD